jgi:hypothetical protein
MTLFLLETQNPDDVHKSYICCCLICNMHIHFFIDCGKLNIYMWKNSKYTYIGNSTLSHDEMIIQNIIT